MTLVHYVKRELETVFVHRFSSETMPLVNIFKNCFGYYFLFGVLTMYFYLHPDYTAPNWLTPELSFAFTALFLLFEFLNLKTHLVLRNLRKEGTTERKIPYGWGFDVVSCANYLWETCAWLTFFLHASVPGGFVCLAAMVYIMSDWALKKHKRYKAEFANYPKERFAIYPFIF